MKRKFNLSLGLIILSSLFTSVSGSEPIAMQEGDKSVQSYFDSYLTGNKTAFKSSEKVKLSKIDELQQFVWSQWQNSNNSLQEQKLIDLRPLEEGNSSSWELPQELEKDAVMPYYFGFKGEMPEAGYPLFLYIHGSGPKASEWATGLKLGNKFEDGPSAYFIPQIPNENSYRWYQKSKQYAWERLIRLTFIREDFDANRFYLFGISEGGYGGQRLASFYADYLAGAGPMAAGEPLRNAPVENCSNTAFSLLTGGDDTGYGRNELTQITKNEFQKFQDQNPGEFDHRIELIPGKGHSIDYSPTTIWLKEKTRNPYPTHFIWENFEMDGIYRDGFYNLYVVERSNDNEESRARYTFNSENNIINLDVDLVTYEVTERNKWGIETLYNKTYKPATKGKVIIYLNSELVDLSKKITININGKTKFSGKVKPTLEAMVNSCAAYYDPERVYPVAIELDVE
ncbi:MAG: hypothetical protein R3Y04_01090 [Rikenellaceae bacterium]